jgi:hypothetical protein
MNAILHLQVLEKILLNLYDTFVNDILGHLNNCKIVHIGQKGHTSEAARDLTNISALIILQPWFIAILS